MRQFMKKTVNFNALHWTQNSERFPEGEEEKTTRLPSFPCPHMHQPHVVSLSTWRPERKRSYHNSHLYVFKIKMQHKSMQCKNPVAKSAFNWNPHRRQCLTTFADIQRHLIDSDVRLSAIRSVKQQQQQQPRAKFLIDRPRTWAFLLLFRTVRSGVIRWSLYIYSANQHMSIKVSTMCPRYFNSPL